MKKILTFFLVVSLILTGIGISSGEKEEIKSKKMILDFSDLVVNEDENYITIELKGTNSEFIQKNHYIVPTYTEAFEFLCGTEIINVQCNPITIHTQLLSKGLSIAPDPVIIGKMSKNTQKNQPVSTINKWFEYDIGMGLIDNNHSVIFKIQVFPVQYNPFEDIVSWAERIEINIQYIESKHKITFGDDYDLLVLSPLEFADELNNLINHKNSIGVSSKLVTLHEIYNGDYFSVNGRDEPEKIKYFIKETIENWGITNILLVGGDTVFPVRKASIVIDYQPPMIMEILTDLYYADIYDANGSFSTWDSNDNDIFCEYNWGPEEETDEVDFYTDVKVGRLPCSNEDEVEIIVDKIINYEISKVYTKDWFTDLFVVGGDTFPDLGGEINEGEYYTEKTISLMQGFRPDKLWASNGRLSGDTGVDNISNALNKGVGFAVFSGHGRPTFWLTHPHKKNMVLLPEPVGYHNSHVLNLTNEEKLPIVILFACSNCDYSISSCFGWSFLSNPIGGGIGSFGSTDTTLGYAGGWVYRGLFGKITYDALMGYRLHAAKTLGDMWSYALNRYIPQFSQDSDVLTMVEFQLFGDPTLMVADDSTPPDKPEIPSGPNSGRRNKEYSFSTVSSDIDGDNLFFRFSWGDEEYSEWIGPFNSNETCTKSHSWSTAGNYTVKVIAKDSNGVMSNWSDPLVFSAPRNKMEYLHMDILRQFFELFPHLNPNKWIDTGSVSLEEKLTY